MRYLNLEIIIRANLNELLEISDKKAMNSWEKSLTKNDMIEKISLREFEPKKNAKEKLNAISDLVSSDDKIQLQVLNLDIRGIKKSVEFKDVWDKPMNNKLENIAFVFKLSKTFLNEFNSFIIFTSIQDINEEGIDITINRIEYMNIPFLEKNINAVHNGPISLSFTFDKNIQKSNDPALIDLLCKTQKINRGLSREDSKEKFKFQDWNDLIHAMNNYYWNKDKQTKDEVFCFGEEISISDKEEEFKKKRIYVCQESKTKYTEKSSKIFLDDGNDKSVSIKIKRIQKSNILQEIKTEIKKTENVISELNVLKNDALNKSNESIDILNNLNGKKEKKNILLQETNNNILDLNRQIKSLENELEFIKKTLNTLQKENKNSDKPSNKINESNHSKKENEDNQNNLKNNLNEQNKSVEKIDNEIKVIKQNIDEAKINKTNYSKKHSDLSKEQTKKEKFLEKQKQILSYLSQDKFLSISELIISSNYRDNDGKRSFKIKDIFDNTDEQNNSKAIRLNWVITNKDVGKIEVIKRYKYSFDNINKGFYKNPYLFYSLLSIPEINKDALVSENKWKNVNPVIREKYNLNDDQEKVIEKSINMRDIFYLQGPPGTGKTQTICAISEEYTNVNNNVLMTSSTHEAINNFFDRLNEKNSNNPNLILLKYRAGFPNEIYGEKTIYDLFLKKISNFSLNKNDDNSSEIYEEYIQKYGKKCPSFPTDLELNLFKKEFEKNGNINSINSPRFQYLLNKCVSWLSLDNLNDQGLIEQLDFYMKNMLKSKYNEEEEQLKSWSLMTEKFSKIIFDFSELEEIYEKKTNNIFEQKMASFKKNIENKKITLNETNFLKYITKNKLINIIGISTTSKTSFEILGKNINLFSEYPIDLVIIDEISKSTTPEILGRVILSKRVIFAGDYKQLPPITGFDENECEDFFENSNFDNVKESKNIIDSRGLHSFIEDLHVTSFFKCEIESVKNNKFIETKNRPYHNLKIQHRFTENIMNCVNHFYDHDEKLGMPSFYNEPNHYVIGAKYAKGNDDFCLIDTSYLNDSFKNKVLDSGVSIKSRNGRYSSFDSNTQLLSRNKINYSSKINEYNAEIIIEIIYGLIKNNSIEKLTNKIGIICMTKSQKDVIKNIIEKQNEKDLFHSLKLKIDTVDNFQGREKDIIIVDFVRSWHSLDNITLSSRPRNLKFYTVLERINVALSRAKSKMILVGSFENHYMDKNTISGKLDKIDFFKNIYEHAKKLDSVIKAWESGE
ncbi:MAG: AAA family ATPase [Mycoplasmataceae bacterium]|nr:AAA family ATPase [Mycoplasmataceae bacterium]